MTVHWVCDVVSQTVLADGTQTRAVRPPWAAEPPARRPDRIWTQVVSAIVARVRAQIPDDRWQAQCTRHDVGPAGWAGTTR